MNFRVDDLAYGLGKPQSDSFLYLFFPKKIPRSDQTINFFSEEGA